MHKPIKFILIALILVIISGGIIYAITVMSFQGTFDKKYTREELIRNFIKHEKDFLDVVNYFKNNIPRKKDYSVSFWQKGKDNISLYLYPDVIDPKNKIIGTSDAAVDSPKLDSALRMLGWSRETLATLTDKLKKNKL